MALPASGALSMSAINTELGVAATATRSLNDATSRTLAGIASGAISFSNFYGKSAAGGRKVLSYTFTTSTVNAALNIATIATYTAGTSDVTVTVNTGIYLWSNSTATAGLTLTGGTTGDTLTLVNNGFIIGRGGNGVDGGHGAANVGIAGGTALSIAYAITINNTNAAAYIAGGGGSGAANYNYNGSGGGAGGGNVALTTTWVCGNLGGATGGTIGATGGNGWTGNLPSSTWFCYCTCSSQYNYEWMSGGGAGGRILPGTGGAGKNATQANANNGFGGGGGSGGGAGNGNYNGQGGSGGSANAVGGVGSSGGCGGGGGWGAAGGAASPYTAGAGGKAVALNTKTVTWVSGNTTRVYGAVA